MLEHIFYLITGVIAGLLAGLLGVGGGIVVVPILNLLFVNQFSSTLTMQMAVGSSLAVMMFTALSSAYAYYRRGLIVWPLFYRFIPGLLLGMGTGAIITMRVSSHSLKIAFAIFMMLVAINMFFSKTVTAQRELPSFRSITFFAFLTGICSGLFGVGGGTLMVPFFLYCNVEMHKATGTSSLCGLPLAILGTICFILTGWEATSSLHMPSWTTGYIYWPAVGLVAIGSMLFAPLGTRLAVWLPAQKLKRVFAVILVITSLYLLK